LLRCFAASLLRWALTVVLPRPKIASGSVRRLQHPGGRLTGRRVHPIGIVEPAFSPCQFDQRRQALGIVRRKCEQSVSHSLVLECSRKLTRLIFRMSHCSFLWVSKT